MCVYRESRKRVRRQGGKVLPKHFGLISQPLPLPSSGIKIQKVRSFTRTFAEFLTDAQYGTFDNAPVGIAILCRDYGTDRLRAPCSQIQCEPYTCGFYCLLFSLLTRLFFPISLIFFVFLPTSSSSHPLLQVSEHRVHSRQNCARASQE